MSQEILVAEDDPRVAAMLREYLERLGFTVRSTSSAHVARQWFQEAGGSVVLDGSVLAHMGIPLAELPTTRVIIWSGDARLVREARQLGLRAFCKGNLQDFQGLLQEVASRDFVSVPTD
jgi:DNA-binding NtrC family response regulator